MQVALFCCFRQRVAGMSQDLGQDVPGLEKLYAGKLWADFSFPVKIQDTLNHDKGQKSAISGRRLHSTFLSFLQWFFPFSSFSV